MSCRDLIERGEFGRQPGSRIKAGRKGGDAGVNRVHLSGRVGKRAVAAGLWRMTVRATTGDVSSKTLRRNLRVVR